MVSGCASKCDEDDISNSFYRLLEIAFLHLFKDVSFIAVGYVDGFVGKYYRKNLFMMLERVVGNFQVGEVLKMYNLIGCLFGVVAKL